MTDTEIEIGSCNALSGPLQERGRSIVLGGRIYFDDVNRAGGIFGRDIKLTSHDDAYLPDKAVDCFNTLLNENVFMGSLFFGTAPAAKYVEMASVHAVPLVGMGTGANFLQDPVKPTVFGVRPLYSDEARAQVDALWSIGIRKIAVLCQSDAYGASVFNGVGNALKAHGATPVAEASFPRMSKDVDEPINRLVKSSPEAVIVGASGGSLLAITRQKATFNGAPLICMSAASEYLVHGNAEDVNGVIVTETLPMFNDVSLPGVALYQKLLTQYGSGAVPGFSSFEGYVAARVVVEGLKHAGRDLTRSGMVKALDSLHDVDLGFGKDFLLNYSPQDHRGFHHIFFVRFHGVTPVPIKNLQELRK